MVVIMQWVAKKHQPLAAVSIAFIAVLAGALTIITSESITSDLVEASSDQSLAISCFETSTATIRISLSGQCSSPLISLGGSALTESATATGEVIEIHPILASRFAAAEITAAREGVNLYITSGFRSQARQEVLFANAIKKYGSETEAAKWVLPAHFSHHPQGLAIDVNYPKDPSGAKWLEDHGARFGLCRVYANEWWHFEGVIAPGASCPAMAENALVDLGQ
jgi:D-alanyl-D-alanine carboxypeptidase